METSERIGNLDMGRVGDTVEKWIDNISGRVSGVGTGEGMGNAGWFLSGALVGSALTLLMDPVSGARRRSLIRDKGVRMSNDLGGYATKTFRHLGNRAQGIKARAGRAARTQETTDDHTLISRVRSEFGRLIRHPGSIRVAAEEGVITLSGPVFVAEVAPLLARVRKVRGVQDVINRLEPHQNDDRVPGLQGQGKRSLQ